MARIQLSGTQIPTLSRLNIDGSFTLDAASGTTGQILISQGSGNTPAWTSSLSAITSLSSAAGIALPISTANAATTTGSLSITTGNVTSSGSSGNISIEVGSTVGGGQPGSISIGNVNTPVGFYLGTASSTINIPGAMSIAGGSGSSGVSISSTGVVDADGTITGGNLTTGGTLTRTILAGGGATTASIDNNGRFIRTTSSARYKDSIEDANYVYQDVLSLSPKTFKLRDEIEAEASPRTYAGFIAEDVHEIDSLRVFVNYLTQEDGSKIPDGIAYGEMVSALVSAIKHQDTLIKSLETRIQQLENQ